MLREAESQGKAQHRSSTLPGKAKRRGLEPPPLHTHRTRKGRPGASQLQSSMEEFPLLGLLSLTWRRWGLRVFPIIIKSTNGLQGLAKREPLLGLPDPRDHPIYPLSGPSQRFCALFLWLTFTQVRCFAFHLRPDFEIKQFLYRQLVLQLAYSLPPPQTASWVGVQPQRSSLPN